MATLVELTKYHDPKKLQPGAEPPRVTVNLDRVKTIQRMGPIRESTYQNAMTEHTVVWFGKWGDDRESVDVMEAPEQIRQMAQLVQSGHAF